MQNVVIKFQNPFNEFEQSIIYSNKEQALKALEKFKDDSPTLVTKIELFLSELMGIFL